MITKVDFRRSDAAALVEYITKDDGERVPVKDHTGRKLDADELAEFVEASKDYGWERHMIVAPDPEADYERATVDRKVRALMTDWRADRQGSQYVYAVHGDDQPHAHVALTGRREAIYMDKQDLKDFRETARKTFRERERIASREQSPEARADPRFWTKGERATGRRLSGAKDSRRDPDPSNAAEVDSSTSDRAARRRATQDTSSDTRATSTSSQERATERDRSPSSEGGKSPSAEPSHSGVNAADSAGLTPTDLLSIVSEGVTDPEQSVHDDPAHADPRDGDHERDVEPDATTEAEETSGAGPDQTREHEYD